jgi:hypothetical protein
VDAFLSGYRAGLIVAALLVAAGGAAAYLGLRVTKQVSTEELAERELVLAA